jgi:hypothetical protein
VFLRLGRPRSVIPPLGTKVVAGSPYARGLIRAWVMNRGTGDSECLLTRAVLAASGAGSVYGGTGHDLPSGSGLYLLDTTVPLATFNSPFTVVMAFSNFNPAALTYVPGFGGRHTGGSGWSFDLFEYPSTGFLGQTVWGLSNQASTMPSPETSPHTQVVGAAYYGGSNSSSRFALNGKVVDFVHNGAGNNDTDGFIVNAAWYFGGPQQPGDRLRVQGVYIYNRALSADELSAITLNPWLPLQPRVRRTYVFTGAGAGGGSVSKTASDTASVSASEARAILSALSRTDAASITVTEAKALLAILSRTDTASLSATEAKALLALVARTDTASLSATEAKALLVLLARGDTASLTVSEVAAIIILTLKAASDTARLTVTESASIQMALVKTASDTASLTVTEARALLALVARADSAGVAVTEARGPIAVSLTRADGAAISAAEAKAILVALARGDAASISAAEAHALLVGFGRADLASLTTTSAAVIVSTTVGEAYLVIFTADALAAPSAMVGDALMAPSTVSGDLLE